MKIISEERCAGYSAPGHPERPARILGTLEYLRKQQEVALTWVEPIPAPAAAVLRAHTADHVARLNESAQFDDDTPSYPGISEYAHRSAGAAILALQAAQAGETVFSLMRPPGHHATRNEVMGFCYLNSIAIAALEARARGAKRVAVYDFDVHHGNGTEAILLNEPGMAFYSIHQSPCYPGTGTANVGDNCFNYPVAPRTPRTEYRKVLQQALDDLKRFQPDVVGISAGFDGYARDPLAQETLEAEDFHWLGTSMRNLRVPTFSILEGGYSRDLPALILAYLKGLEG